MDDVNVESETETVESAKALVGTYHRIAGIGPSYEVLEIIDDRDALIVLLETGETTKYRIEDIRLDPHPDDDPVEAEDDLVRVQAPRPERLEDLVGEWRRFGPHGPRYEVLSIEDEKQATIRVHSSGEVTKYEIADILNDPED